MFIEFDHCVFKDFGRRGPEAQDGATVILNKCVIWSWGIRDLFSVRSFAGWAHTDASIVMNDCVLIQEHFNQSGWLNMLIDIGNHIGNDFNEGSLSLRSLIPGTMRGLYASTGGRVEFNDSYKPWWVYVEGAKPWGEKADIALPSATQNELNGDHARQLIANGVMAVSEGANMPSTPEAIKVFQDAKILYAPGKAANAGGVSVSGLEMTQNSIKLSWSAEEVDEKLKSIMKNIHEACVQYGTEADGYVNYVKGANVAGFMKVAKAMMAQGIL